jgi:hypothetical protein
MHGFAEGLFAVFASAGVPVTERSCLTGRQAIEQGAASVKLATAAREYGT